MTATATFGPGYSGNVYIQHVLFFGGDFKGQWFDYIGAEGQALPITANGELSGGVAAQAFVGINNPNIANSNTPDGFAGPYSGNGASGGYKPLFAGLVLSGQYSISNDKAWAVYGLGVGASFGPEAGAFVGVSAAVEHHNGTIALLNKQFIQTTKNISWGNLIINWLNHTVVR